MEGTRKHFLRHNLLKETKNNKRIRSLYPVFAISNAKAACGAEMKFLSPQMKQMRSWVSFFRTKLRIYVSVLEVELL